MRRHGTPYPQTRPTLDEDILALVRALAKRRALLDHEAEIAQSGATVGMHPDTGTPDHAPALFR